MISRQNNLISFYHKVYPRLRQLALFLLTMVPFVLHAQELGLPPYRYFSPQEYQAASRNWSLVLDSTGVLYSANEEGVLRYDGISWQLLELPKKQKAYWIEKDDQGNIYVGANSDFGLLTSRGNSMVYKSLADRLPSKFRDFNVVWEVQAGAAGVVFRSRKYIFTFFHDQLKAYEVPPGGRIFDAAYSARDKVYFRVYDLGIAYVDGYGVQVLPNSEYFAKKKVNGIYAYGKDELLIATRFEGLFIYNEQDGVRKFTTETDDYLIDNKIYDGHHLKNGNYVFATMANGIVEITPDGREELRFDSSNGLTNNATLFVTENDNTLWLGTKNGIFQMAHQAPYRIVETEFGLKGQVTDVLGWNGHTYVTCNDGFYQLKETGSKMAFEVVNKNSIVDCVSLFEHDNKLHIGSLEGIFQYDGNEPLVVSKFTPREVISTDIEGYYLAAEFYYGLNTIQFIDEEIILSKVPGIDRLVNQIFKVSKNRFWAKSIEGVLYEVSLRDVGEGVWEAQIDQEVLLPPDTYFIQNQGKYLIISGNQLYTLEGSTLKPWGELVQFQYEPDKLIFTSTLNNGGNIICYENAQGSIYCEKFSSAENGIVSTGKYFYVDFHPDVVYEDRKSNELWIGGADGIRIFSDLKVKNSKQSKTLIRQLSVNDSTILLEDSKRYILSNSENNIGISFISNSQLSEGKVLFQYRLNGADKSWSPWTERNEVVYSSLPSGKYQFQVRSKSPYVGLTAESTLFFEIRDPWYLTVSAYVFYVIVFLLLVYFLYRIRVRALLKNKEDLESMVKFKTKELAEANKELYKKASKLEQLGKFKSRFFSNVSHDLRTPIALLSGRVQLLQADEKSQFSEKANIYLKRLGEDAGRLVSMVDDIQELVQMQEGRMTLNLQKIAVEPYVKSITTLFEASAKEKGIELSFMSLLKEGVEAELDPHCLERILYNLISNAMKFTPSHGKIQVLLSEDSSHFQLKVIDDGLGIPPQDLEEIFNRNFQSDNQVSGSKGLGIGLNVVSELVKLHGGEVRAGSEEDKGATFTVRLPWTQS